MIRRLAIASCILAALAFYLMYNLPEEPAPEEVSLATPAKLWSLTIEEADGSLHDHYVVAQTYTQAHNLLLPNEGGDRQIVAYGNVAIPIAVYCGHGTSITTTAEELTNGN